MKWSVRTLPTSRPPPEPPARNARVCCATERAAMMGSTTAKSLSASSCECCRHCLHTAPRVLSKKALERGEGEKHARVYRRPTPLIALEVWFHCDLYLENSGLMLSSSLRLCRFLRAGYKEETASRLPLHSSSTSEPLQGNIEKQSVRVMIKDKSQETIRHLSKWCGRFRV